MEGRLTNKTRLTGKIYKISSLSGYLANPDKLSGKMGRNFYTLRVVNVDALPTENIDLHAVYVVEEPDV